DRVRFLEGERVKLEQSYRTVAQALKKARDEVSRLEKDTSRLQGELVDKESLQKERDDLRKLAQENQVERDRLARQLARRTREREELRQELSQRTGERDVAQGRCERFRKGLQNLLAEDDTPLQGSPSPEPPPPPPGPVLSGQS